MKVEEIVRTGASRIESIRVRNALNPILWLTVPGPAIFLTAAWLFRDHAVVLGFLVAMAAVPVIAAIVAYFVLLFRSPDRLQSEEYRIRQIALRMLYRRGKSPEIVDVANQVARIEVWHPQIDDGAKS
jgi:hypothetical protein